MAKTIKFNLIMDGNPVRSLDGLKENFSIEDILKYFKNGLLERWLKVRGFDKEFTAVNELDKNADDKTIVKELIKIFDGESNEGVIDKAIEILAYLEAEEKRIASYEKNKFKKKTVIDDYISGYRNLVEAMKSHKDNMAQLKADAEEMADKYAELFEFDQYALFNDLIDNAPKAVFAMLTRGGLCIFRRLWFADSQITSKIESMLKPATAKEILGDDLKIVCRNTAAMWDMIEPETKVAVIHIAEGTFVKNAGSRTEKIGAEYINGNLLLLNGLEYQCNNKSYELLYMEV